jgi:hypothetical protein
VGRLAALRDFLIDLSPFHRLCAFTGSNVGTMVTGVGAGLRFDSSFANPEYGSGGNEIPVQNALAQCLRSGLVFYDVGANVGFFSVIGARLVGPSGSVQAFEPVRRNASAIRRARRSGKSDLLLTGYSGGAVLSSADHRTPDVRRVLTVETLSIDDFIFKQNMARPHVVKIDVEGAEIDVLSGMERTLLELRPIVIYEIDDADIESFLRKQELCDAFVRDCGYRVTRLQESYPNIRWIVGHSIASPC